MVDGSTNQLGEWLAWIQLATALAIPPFLIWYYRRFVVGFLRFATTYLGLTAVLVVLYLMVYGLLGSGLGIPYLFWHDDFQDRAFSSTGATMLLALVGVIAYYLDPYPWATDRRTAEFLQADERIKHRIEGWYSRWLPLAAARPDNPRWAGIELRWWDYLTFGMNLLIDPIVITPVQSLLEPDQENSLRLQRFLRVARGPFLLLLLAPALLPAVFTEVPRAAPTGKLGLESLHSGAPPTYDVSRDLGGYLLGLAAWLLGIQAGVLIVKAFIRFSTLLHGTRISNIARWLVQSVCWDLQRSRGMAMVRAAYGRVGEVFGADPPGDPESWVRPDPQCPNAVADACPVAGCPRGEPTVEPSSHPSSHPDCLARGQLLFAAIAFALLFLATYFVLGYVRYLRVNNILPQYPLFGLPLFDLPPAVAICAALAVLAMGYAAIAYLPRTWQIPVVLVLVAWFGYANNKHFKNQFENMSYNECDLVRLRERVIEAYDSDPKNRIEESGPKFAPMHLVSDNEVLTAWKAGSADGGPDLDGKGRPKLVLVVVSGGATRSAYWTAVVLDRLERTLGPSFGRRVRIISGASGGMLGAACYVTYRKAVAEWDSAEREGAREVFDLRLMSSLNDVSGIPTEGKNLIIVAAVNNVLHFRMFDDNGKRVVDTDEQRLPGQTRQIGDLRKQLASLWPLQELRRRDKDRVTTAVTSIVDHTSAFDLRLMSSLNDVSGIPTEGKNLIIVAAVNNVLHFRMFDNDCKVFVDTDEQRLPKQARQIEDLRKQLASMWPPHELTWSDKDRVATAVTSIVDVDPDGTVYVRSSLSSLEYFRVFREKAHRDLFLSTAVRMSASFPYVSPAVNLPTKPPRRVVDAGYYDNYGMQVAVSWVRRNRPWLAKHTSGVLLVQIRDSSSVLDRRGVDTAAPGFLESASRGFQFITSPIDAVAEARYTTASFRNDADVAELDPFHWDFRDESGRPDKPERPESFFTTVIFENSAEVSLDPGDFWSELTKLDQNQPARRDFREVSMSWYLARAEMEATATAIPGDPPDDPKPREPDWRKGAERRRIIDKLNGQLNSQDSSLPPGPDRAIRLKRLDQLYNYERLINLKVWWNRKTR